MRWMPIMIRPEEFDLQLFFYTIFSIFIIIGVWRIPFVKTKTITKLIFLVSFITYFYMPQMLPSVMKQFDYIFYSDTGLCSEGLKIKAKDEIIEMNKENCLKNHWKWNEEGKWCNTRD
jgi:hypothetical protein